MTYSVILADPPWTFTVRNPAKRHRPDHYPLMTTAEITALRPPASKNCALFLWACWPNLKDALQVIDAWGFEYKTIAWVWAKFNKSGLGLFTGMGYYTRGNTEPCLLAVRGNMPVAAHDVLSVIMSPVREHSRKPDEQYAKIERLYPHGPYLEMFARRRWSDRWAVWGNEVNSTVDIAALAA